MANTEQKITKIVDGLVPSIEATVAQLSSFGALAVFIVAEDVNSPGTYERVQGQFDSNGNFVLLTNGTGTTTPTGPSGDALLLESGDYVLLETGDYLLLE